MIGAPTARISPRTVEEPMAFTWREFRSGALTAWGVFNVVAPFAIAVLAIVLEIPTGSAGGAVFVLIFAPLFLLPVSFAALVVLGAPLGYALGRALRRVAREGVHLAAFGALGALVGAITGVVILGVWAGEWDMRATLLCAAVTAFPVAFGRWHAMGRAAETDATAGFDTPASRATQPAKEATPPDGR